LYQLGVNFLGQKYPTRSVAKVVRLHFQCVLGPEQETSIKFRSMTGKNPMKKFSAIFADFCAEKMAFFLKEWYDRIFAKTSGSLGKKRHFFAKFFVESNFKIIK
jgi:hypothetical protein